jgi:ubiquitin C-terminal hydrolase
MKIINEFNPTHDQQDAQEFLSFILDNLQIELLELQKSQESPELSETENPSTEPPNFEETAEESKIPFPPKEPLNPRKASSPKDSEEGWMETDKKGTQMKLNPESGNLKSTIISKIFGGVYKNKFKMQGCSQSSATFQPFFLINLDITKALSVQLCLDNFFKVQQINGNFYFNSICIVPIIDYLDDRRGELVKATHKQTLHKLPNILILHFKRFVFSKETLSINKIQEHVGLE